MKNERELTIQDVEEQIWIIAINHVGTPTQLDACRLLIERIEERKKAVKNENL